MTDAQHRRSAGLKPRGYDLLMVSAAAFLVYLPALWTGFVADDFFILARLKQFGGLAHPVQYFGALGFFEYYRPLTFLSHAIDWQIWGMRAAGFHLTNVFLHAINAALIVIVGHRFGRRTPALVAGLLFALHPASHEAVYWISARFDLLATCLSLLSLILLTGSTRQYPFGVACFGFALLAKESAIALPVIFLAHEVVVRGADARRAVRRVLPLLGVGAVYGVMRWREGALEPAGGAGRLPKLLLLAAIAMGLVWMARAGSGPRTRRLLERRDAHIVLLLLAVGTGALAALSTPALSGWMREKIGFASFSSFFLISPIAVPAAPAWLFDRPEPLHAAIELIVLLALGLSFWGARRWLLDHPEAVFSLVFVAAALAPVSSMTSGPRYLYLASAGFSLFGGIVFASLPTRLRSLATTTFTLILCVSAVQIFAAGRSWKWASDMTRGAVASMTPAFCGADHVVVLTTPVAIRGVFSNLNEVAFEVNGCGPASFATLMRVMYKDAHVDAARRGDVIELRVGDYRGNFLASRDLRHFDQPIAGAGAVSLETPLGRLDSSAADGARTFRLTLNDQSRDARFFYFSDGQVVPLPSSVGNRVVTVQPQAIDR